MKAKTSLTAKLIDGPLIGTEFKMAGSIPHKRFHIPMPISKRKRTMIFYKFKGYQDSNCDVAEYIYMGGNP